MAVLSHALPLYESIRDTEDPGPPRGTLFFRKSAPSYIVSRSTATSTSFRLSRMVNWRFLTARSAIFSRFARSALRSARIFEYLSSYVGIGPPRFRARHSARDASGLPHPRRGPPEEDSGPQDRLPVEVEFSARQEILDHVPVDGRVVLPARLRVGAADGEVDRPSHLLVHQDVAGKAGHSRVRPDPEFAQPAGARVGGEHLLQVRLVLFGGCLDDLSLAEGQADSRDLA